MRYKIFPINYHYSLPVLVLLLSLLIGCKSSTTDPPKENPTWHAYTTSNTSLRSDFVNSISLDQDGKVWFATREGALYFQNGYWGNIYDSLYTIVSFSGYNDTSYNVLSVVQAQDRAMWFGLAGGGLVRYQPRSDRAVWRRYHSPDIPFDRVLTLAADRTFLTTYGEMWVGTALGVSKFTQTTDEGGSWQQFRKDDHISQLSSNQVWVIAINEINTSSSHHNAFWFGTQTGGPVEASYGGSGTLYWTPYPFPTDINSKINSISFDSRYVWFGNDNGAATYDLAGGTWNAYTPESTSGKLPGGSIHAILAHDDKLRWFGTDSGLVRFNDTTWTRYTRTNSPLPSDTITSLQYDKLNDLWIGTPAGIAVYNPKGLHF